MSTFDANTWIGAWPFSLQPRFDARRLAAHLARHGIEHALVSPLDAVFAPEPGPANRELLRTTKATPELLPVPVVNPALANWRDELATCATDARVRCVRLLPAYHGYRLRSPHVADLAAELVRRDLRLAVTMRLIDERHEYWALRIKPVPVAELQAWLARRRDVRLLAGGLTRAEIQALDSDHLNLLVDLSFAEWHNTIEHLLTRAGPASLAFASHTPFLVTAAATAKLAGADLPPAVRKRVAAGNLTEFLAPLR